MKEGNIAMPFAKNTAHDVVHLVRVSGIYHALLSIPSTDHRSNKLGVPITVLSDCIQT
jgi:hypothetical protein